MKNEHIKNSEERATDYTFLKNESIENLVVIRKDDKVFNVTYVYDSKKTFQEVLKEVI